MQPDSVAASSEPTLSAWFVDSREMPSKVNPTSDNDSMEILLKATVPNLDLLVADIATLARSYLHGGVLRQMTASPRLAGSGEAVSSATLRRIDDPETGGSAEENPVELLGAVRTLLDTALQKMRASTCPPTEAPGKPTAVPRPRGGIAPSALRRVREHIEKNLGEHIEIADLANLTGLSPCHFSRAFKQSVGMPPHRYLISRRVQEAAKLIESTDRPMFEIALDVGFSDQSHFTRVFSSQVGESPSQFRHQRR